MALEKKDWKEQLKEIGDPKVTELRNDREITRAVRYIEEELAAYLDPSTSDAASSPSKSLIIGGLVELVKNIGLGQTNKELARSVDDLLAIVEQLDQAARDLALGAEAQLAELVQEIEKAQPVNRPLEQVMRQLELRNRESERIRPVHEALLDQVADLEWKISNLDKQLAVPDCQGAAQKKQDRGKLVRDLYMANKNLSTLTEQVMANRRAIERLSTFENALRIVGEGLPKEILPDK